MLKQIKKTLAVLLAVCFLATVTAGAVSAHVVNEPHTVDVSNHYNVHNEYQDNDHHKIVQRPLPFRENHKIPRPMPKPAPEHRI